MEQYDSQKIEKKWQKYWEENGINQVDLDKVKKPFYNLMMFPYPSAEGLHIGNMYAFVHSDVYGRFMRLKGFDVFEPIGLDGFGIHSENYAIKIKEHIKDVSARTEKHFYEQLRMIGNQYDWSRTVETYKPNYYKWTQWLFLKMHEKGLAYRKKAYVNWCPSCKTVLSDEQVIVEKCERCDTIVEKKEMEQWFWRITEYADRLLKNLDWIDWSEEVKMIQKNWIGKSEGAQFSMKIHPVKSGEAGAEQFNGVKDSEEKIEVYTTRLDTVFGMTYAVLAPEHPVIKKLKEKIENYSEIEQYVIQAQNKTNLERTDLQKEKTGVELKGIKIINPFNQKELPLFVADYVLGFYGTGAVMAVPAHDERDFEFAKKYDLPIIQSVTPDANAYKKSVEVLEALKEICEATKKQNVKFWLLGGLACAFYARIIYRNFEDLDLMTKDEGSYRKIIKIFNTLGFEKVKEKKLSENLINSVYKNKKGVEIDIGPYVREFEFRENDFKEEEKALNQYRSLVVSERFVKSFKKGQLESRNKEKDRVDWEYLNGKVFVEDGFLVNSGEYGGLSSIEARDKLVNWLVKNNIGDKKIHYKLRDWCISRQRYWGPPIPMIECGKCGWVPVSEKDLPVLLPEMDDFLPDGTGKGPLNKVENFVKTICPKCGGSAKRETDVSDPFVDSCWYYMRYPNTEFEDKPMDKERLKKWMPVSMYIGGKEHSVLHLLYSRFINMVMYEMGYVPSEEPFEKFRAHGLLIKDGVKMSKSKGNVINPDDYIAKFSSDTMRMYLMFLGDMRQGGDWRDSGIAGMHKFINRIWNIQEKISGENKLKNLLHKTIKGINDDLEKLKCNTAIAKLMILVNKIYEAGCSKTEFEIFLILLSSFAPHISEELWQQLGHNESIFREKWPAYDPKLMKDEKIMLVVQVNGKLRDYLEADANESKNEVKEKTLQSEKIKKFIGNKEIKKVIYVKGKIINIVI